MKFLIERGTLVDTMAAITRVAQRSGELPIRACVKIETQGDRIAITGLDAHVWLTVKAAAEIQQPGATVVNAALLADAAKACAPGSQVEFNAPPAAEDNAPAAFGTVKAGKARFRLPLLPAADFPSGKDLGDATAWTIAATDLRFLLGRVSHAMSTDDTKYYLNGVFLTVARDVEGDGGLVLRAFATDSSRAASAHVAAEADVVDAFAELTRHPIIPRQTVAHLLRFTEADGAVGCKVADGQISFEFADTLLISRLLDADFPDVEQVFTITARHNLKVAVGRSDLSDLVARLTPFAGGAKEKSLVVEFSGTVAAASARVDASEANDEIATGGLTDGQPGGAPAPISVILQTKFLRDCLEAGAGDRVELAMLPLDVKVPGSATVRFAFPDEPRLRLMVQRMRA